MLDVARCLTLNASYEPVALVPVKRAIVLVVSEKAEIVEANLEQRFRSERSEYPYPLVIRLVKYVELPRRLRKHVTNAILFARDNYRCQYCSKHRNDLVPTATPPPAPATRAPPAPPRASPDPLCPR